MGRLCEELIDHFRNLMLLKTMNNPEALIILSAQERERAKSQSESISLENIVYVMDVLQSSYDRMFRGSNKRTEIELALIKLTSPQLDTSVEALAARVAKLERIIKRGIPVTESATQAVVDNKSNTTQTLSVAETENAESVIQPQKPQEPTLYTKTQSEAKPQTSAVVNQTKTDYDTIVKNAVPMEDWQEVLDILKNYSITIATSFKIQGHISAEIIY